MTENDFIKQFSNLIINNVKAICKNLNYDTANECIITQVINPGKYKVKIHEREYTATSYYDFQVGNSVYAIAPQNNYNKLFLIPYHK